MQGFIIVKGLDGKTIFNICGEISSDFDIRKFTKRCLTLLPQDTKYKVEEQVHRDNNVTSCRMYTTGEDAAASAHKEPQTIQAIRITNSLNYNSALFVFDDGYSTYKEAKTAAAKYLETLPIAIKTDAEIIICPIDEAGNIDIGQALVSKRLILTLKYETPPCHNL